MTAPVPVWDWYRYCPGCGAVAEQRGTQPFRCSHCGFANFFGPVAAVGGLIVDEHSRLLMVRRANDPGRGKWGLPGGFVDAGESIEQALRREVREETCLELDRFAYLMSGPNDYNYRGIVAPVIDLFFLARTPDTSGLRLAADELTEHIWTADPSEQLNNMAFASNAKAVRKWMDEGIRL